MSWQAQLRDDSVSWLLDYPDPGVRYLALRDLLDLAVDDPLLADTRELAHRQGPIATVLDAMHADGYWVSPGAGYNPKYRSTVWALILLAQLGASAAEDVRIGHACDYLLQHALTVNGQFSTSGAPSGTIDCLQGNLCHALQALGWQDPRMDNALEWMARSVTGEGVAPKEERNAALRYYSSQCGPGFACGNNNQQPCAWGGVKVMLALGRVPVGKRTPLTQRAIAAGAEFLMSTDPARALYPTGGSQKPNRAWWKFGFPVFYVTDILQLVEALVSTGYGGDARVRNAVQLIRDKQDALGRWSLDYDYAGKTWGSFGTKTQPNPWVTLRACRVLKHAL